MDTLKKAEQASSKFNIVDQLDTLLKKKKDLLPQKYDIPTLFKHIGHSFWALRAENEPKKTMQVFLQTTMLNSHAKQMGIKIHKETGLGQPGMEIGLDPKDVSDYFGIEIYSYKYDFKQTSKKPTKVSPIIEVLTGHERREGESNLVEFLTRLKKEEKATFEQDGNDMIFNIPIPKMPGIHIDGRFIRGEESEKPELTITLDINVPYEVMEKYLNSPEGRKYAP